MFFILIIVVGLVAWALHLMQEAIQRQEFSLMLAGFLVSVAAAAMMTVYFLTGNFVGYMSSVSHGYQPYDPMYDYTAWESVGDEWSVSWPEYAVVDSGRS